MTADALVAVSRRLSDAVDELSFADPVHTVYNPLVYARRPHEAYLRRFGEGRGRVVFLGMNPGPWGMAQTGVPFGEIGAVRDWMGLAETVDRPAHEHPKRPITGLNTRRSEVSGARLWGWARDRFGTPEAFFARCFVTNWCPLVFMEASGRNRVPEKLPREEREPLEAACDLALAELVQILAPEVLVGVGAFARAAAERVVGGQVPVGQILHPSPASPKANAGWAEQVEAELREQGIRLSPG